jgi:PPOX class probable F420-dependent enzyme
MRLESGEARRRFAAAAVARLATVTPDRHPHIVPVTFAVEGDRIYSIVDAVKPKASLSLARLRNIEESPQVSLLVDEYDNDWHQLWWARADGTARIATAGPEWNAAKTLLVSRYPQYRRATEFGPATIVEVERWSGWAARA